jgi:general secretion pathway protein I
MLQPCKGFTLIEVLIALAILSIALTAIIKATAQNIRDTAYLQDKTIANWVGTQVINEARTGILKLGQEPLEQTTEMLGQQWAWQATVAPTPNSHIREIHVDVSKHSKKLIGLVSYIYVAQPSE